MRGCACLNCGTRQKIKLEPQSMATMQCSECGREFVVKMDRNEIAVTAKIAKTKSA